MKKQYLRLAALLAAVLVISSTATPALATASLSAQTPHDSVDAPPIALSSQELRLGAIDRLGGASVNKRFKQNAVADLRDSVFTYIDSNRTTNASFHSDRKIAARTQGKAPGVGQWLAASDRNLAAQAISDVERTRSVLNARDISFDESAVESELASARKAFETGEKIRQKSPVGAISQYQRAWAHAQSALDTMDAAVEPRVTIETREDPNHDGPTQYMLSGTVFDVRTYELTSVTLSVNGVTRTTVPLTTNTTPATTSEFQTMVLLEQRVNNVTVVATDPGTTLGDSTRIGGGDSSAQKSASAKGKSKGKNSKKKGHDSSTRGDGASIDSVERGADSLFLDADGLPDLYETSVTETNPLDFDSDSSRTTADEAENGIIDGLEDFDDDGAVTIYEYVLGIDPHNPDTDGDGLRDGFEVQYPVISPNATDADGDGIADPDTDHDNDSLSALDEQELGTSPLVADTDGDGLPDGREAALGIDPLSNDTDSDGVVDAEELELGTNPLTADSDGDGILDGSETFTSTTTDPESGISVDVTAVGGTGGVSVQTVSNSSPEGDRVSNVYHLSNRTSFDQATVALPLDDSVEGDVTIYKWDPTSDTFWKPVETSVVNGTALTTVRSFSYFTVVSENSVKTAQKTRSGWAEPSTSVQLSWPERETFDDLAGWSSTGDVTTKRGEVTLRSKRTPKDTGDGDGDDGDDSDDGGDDDDSDDDDDDSDDDDDGDGGSGPIICPTSTVDAAGDVTVFCIPPPDDDDDDGDDDDDSDIDSPICINTADYSAETADEISTETVSNWSTVNPEDGPRGTVNATYVAGPCIQSQGVGISTADTGVDLTGPNVSVMWADADTLGFVDAPESDDESGSLQKVETDGTRGASETPERSSTSRKLTLKDDVEELTISIRARGDASDGTARVVVEGKRDSETVIVLDGESTTYFSSNADISRFAGETVSVRLETTGTASLTVDEIDVRTDTDGDGYRDIVEEAASSLTVHSVTESGLEAHALGFDPESADSDRDGLADRTETRLRVSDAGDSLSIVAAEIHSLPGSVDSDDDGLADIDEASVGTAALASDTDGDGFIDSEDINPLTYDVEEPGPSALDNARAMLEGALLGEIGFTDGFIESGYRDSGWYVAGWVVASIVPGVDIVADLRDFVQNVASGDTVEAALDAAGIIPILGKVGDTAKVAKIVKRFVTKFPRKSWKLVKVQAEVLLRHAPIESRKIYEAAGYGDEALELLESGLTTEGLDQLVRKLDDGETLADIKSARKIGDEVVYLTNDRWKHIKERHITGDVLGPEITDYFPTGRTIPQQGARPSLKLPDSIDKSGIEELIFLAKKYGDTDPSDTVAKTWNPKTRGLDYGIDNIRVIVDDGRVISAYPTSGSKVWQWDDVNNVWTRNI